MWNEFKTNLKRIWSKFVSGEEIYQGELSMKLSKKSKIGLFDGINKSKTKEEWVSFIQRQFYEKFLFW